MSGVPATTVTPCATAARAIVNDTDKFGAPSSTRAASGSAHRPGPQKPIFGRNLGRAPNMARAWSVVSATFGQPFFAPAVAELDCRFGHFCPVWECGGSVRWRGLSRVAPSRHSRLSEIRRRLRAHRRAGCGGQIARQLSAPEAKLAEPCKMSRDATAGKFSIASKQCWNPPVE
jgi:hypothetical protein